MIKIRQAVHKLTKENNKLKAYLKEEYEVQKKKKSKELGDKPLKRTVFLFCLT